MSLIKLLWCKVVGHKPSETLYSKECDGSMESYNICDRCGREVNRTTFYDCTDFTPEDLINESVLGNTKKGPNTPPKIVDINDIPTLFGDIEEKPKFQVIDSAPRRFITDRCVHEYELAPFQKYKDIRVLKCKLCGKIKKENMRIKKSKKDD
jgi:hypothetical protein